YILQRLVDIWFCGDLSADQDVEAVVRVETSVGHTDIALLVLELGEHRPKIAVVQHSRLRIDRHYPLRIPRIRRELPLLGQDQQHARALSPTQNFDSILGIPTLGRNQVNKSECFVSS